MLGNSLTDVLKIKLDYNYELHNISRPAVNGRAIF